MCSKRERYTLNIKTTDTSYYEHCEGYTINEPEHRLEFTYADGTTKKVIFDGRITNLEIKDNKGTFTLEKEKEAEKTEKENDFLGE